MKLISNLLFPRRANASSAKRSKIRGLSTAELVGIIVIVGILGALGGTYITGLISQSKTNTGVQNAQSLTTTLASAMAAGAVNDASGSAGTVDLTSASTAIAALNAGVVVGTVTYRMNPAVQTPASYVLDSTKQSFSFTTTAGAAP